MNVFLGLLVLLGLTDSPSGLVRRILQTAGLLGRPRLPGESDLKYISRILSTIFRAFL